MKLSISIILIVAIISTQGRHLELRNKRQTNKNVGDRFLFPDSFMHMQGGPSGSNRGDEFEHVEVGNGNVLTGQGDMDPFSHFGGNQQSGNQQTGNQQGNPGNQGNSNQGNGGQVPSTTAAPTTTSQPPRVRACIEKCPATSEFSPICGSNGVLYFNLSRFNCAVKCGVDVRQLTRSNCP